jgi:hypothetical protein
MHSFKHHLLQMPSLTLGLSEESLLQPGVVVPAYNSNSWEAKERGLQVQI